MEVIQNVPILGDLVTLVIPFLIVLGVVVFVHEYGHYIVGRWCGIGAQTFSIGFGPRLLGWRDKRGTEWQIAALPLGGFVKFVGDMDPASAGKMDEANLTQAERKEAFHNAPLAARAATVAAGPFFNFALSIILFAMLAFSIGAASDEPVIGEVTEELPADIDLRAGDRVLAMDGVAIEEYTDIITTIFDADGAPITALVERDGAETEVTFTYPMAAVIQGVSPGNPASSAGIIAGDTIVTLNGEPMSTFREVQLATVELPLGAPITLGIRRDGVDEILSFTIIPDTVERFHPVTREREPLPTLGINGEGASGLQPLREALPLDDAVVAGFTNTAGIITNTLGYIGDLVFGSAPADQLGGPIRIAQVSKERAERGLLEMVHLIAFLSTSIGLLNLFPIPVLDGGHLMFYAVEAARGRPVGEAAQRYGTMVGLSLVLLLMVFATYNDVLRL
ncbi:MAG: RIP metalloprotease RseP [Pseudomonadota bacterium]